MIRTSMSFLLLLSISFCRLRFALRRDNPKIGYLYGRITKFTRLSLWERGQFQPHTGMKQIGNRRTTLVQIPGGALIQGLGVSIFACCWLLLSASGVQAETIVVSDTIPVQVTNWADELTIPAFQSHWGLLTSITMTFDTPISGTVSFENTGNDAAVITSTHAVSINVKMLNGSLLDALPSAIRVETVPPFDGTRDFKGASGDTFDLNTSVSLTQLYTTTAELERFYGTGELRFPITATGVSYVQGPGNIDAVLRAQAAGTIFTIYFNFLALDYEVEKLTNGSQADDANGSDVPLVAPGDAVTWTYHVRNTGQFPIPFHEIVVQDSDPTVQPRFVASSDDGDNLLSLGETWLYQANGVATDLQQPSPTLSVVDGCMGIDGAITNRAYENVVTVTIRGDNRTDPSHYCNPQPAIQIEKLTNGYSADDAGDTDVPALIPGSPITWTYLVTNTGWVSFTLDELNVTDSDPTVNPTYDPTSDDGDGLLAPGEMWRFLATGTALDLALDHNGVTIVDGCAGSSDALILRAYQNMATVEVRNVLASDPSHYCNITLRRLEPGIALKKFINDLDADGPDDVDVPFFSPGETITWTYLVTNTGDISFTLSQVELRDDDTSLTITFDTNSDDGDNMLAPGETWRYWTTGRAQDLLSQTTTVTTVDGCDQDKSGTKSPAYRNTGTVTIDTLQSSDPAHYCNFPPTAISRIDDHEDNHSIYLPWVAR